jgi:hypothetical protein
MTHSKLLSAEKGKHHYGPAGENLKRTMIDLFADKITTQRTIKFKSVVEQVLDELSVFSAIVDAFDEMKTALKESSSLGD